jgi:hypothetical protein
MDNLKTLNEIKDYNCYACEGSNGHDVEEVCGCYTLNSVLRQEAIKHLKSDDVRYKIISAEYWIKHFFNITDEELE